MAEVIRNDFRQVLNKVPDVTLAFWLVKIMSTTVGETCADYLAVNVGWGTAITGIVMGTLFLCSLAIQLFSPRYIPWIYWLTVVLISVVGTQITDVLTDNFGVSLYLSTAVFSVALIAIFIFWQKSEKTLSVNSITTRKRELFYWSAILCTFALGTAAGDLATEALGWGFRVGVVIFGAAIVATAIAFKLGMNSVLAFWVTYILTRPLGASLGDLLSQAQEYGGIGLGATKTTIAFLSVIIVVVGFLTLSQNQRLKLENGSGHG